MLDQDKNQIPVELKRHRLNAMLMFNKHAIKSLQFLLLNNSIVGKLTANVPNIQLISQLFMNSKYLIFRSVKEK